MKEIKSSFTTEKPLDYTKSKDAYDGNLNSAKETDEHQDKNISKGENAERLLY